MKETVSNLPDVGDICKNSVSFDKTSDTKAMQKKISGSLWVGR